MAKKHLRTIYCDVDDIVLLSSEAFIAIANNKFSITPPKTFADLKDWGYRSIYKGMTTELLVEIYSSEEFWTTVEPNPDFISLISQPYISNYNFVFCSKCDQKNLDAKEAALKVLCGNKIEYSFAPIPHHVSKNSIDMSHGIQIDDNYKNLEDTNASLKILCTNGIETSYNKCPPNKEDVYIVNRLLEVQDILKFDFETGGKFYG